MPRSCEEPSKPPAGGTAMPVHSDLLLHELRNGEREAFVRYYELYRLPVYNLVRSLLRDGDEAVPATVEVFTTAYRRILLDDDCNALRELTYTAALDVCRERLGEKADRGETIDAAGGDRRRRSDLGRRLEQALEMLPFRYQAVLRLHDFNGLRPLETAIVFRMTEDAAGALLFRAREAFRRAFEELSRDRRGTSCRLAEQAAASAVGRSLPDDDVRRLQEHAGYCRHCRRTLKGWGGGAISLALFLEDAPLPQELEATPVFGTTSPIAGAPGAVAGSGALTRRLAQIGRAVTSRAAAYAVAAACLAVSVGLAAQLSHGDRAFVPSAAAPMAPRAVPSDVSVVRPPISARGRVVAPRARSLASSESHSGTSEPTVTAVADAGMPDTIASVADPGDSSGGGLPTVGRPGAASAKGPSAVAPRGDTERGAKATNAGHVSARHAAKGGTRHAKTAVKERVGKHRGKKAEHAAKGGTRHAKTATKELAGKHSGKAVKHAGRGGTQHAKTATKEHAGKRGAHKKNKKTQ